MILCSLKENPQYIKEFILICKKQWGTPWEDTEFKQKLEEKIQSIIKRLEKYPTLILLEENKLVGFISLFEEDCEERNDLGPWYATLYVKKEYRGKHLSKILNDAIIEEAKKLGYNKIYLKTDLDNFYEKYGFNYLETTKHNEKIYYFQITSSL